MFMCIYRCPFTCMRAPSHVHTCTSPCINVSRLSACMPIHADIHASSDARTHTRHIHLLTDARVRGCVSVSRFSAAWKPAARVSRWCFATSATRAEGTWASTSPRSFCRSRPSTCAALGRGQTLPARLCHHITHTCTHTIAITTAMATTTIITNGFLPCTAAERGRPRSADSGR